MVLADSTEPASESKKLVAKRKSRGRHQPSIEYKDQVEKLGLWTTK